MDQYLTVAQEINNIREYGQELAYCIENNEFYHYKDGVFLKIHDLDLMAMMAETVPRFNNFTISMRRAILENIKYLKRKHLTEFNWSPLMNLKNTMLNPYDEMDVLHSYAFLSTIQLPYSWQIGAECDLWLKSLDEIFEGNKEAISTLQEFFGYCLTKETKYEKALLLLGESRSGKSTILTILRHMIGIDNCSSVALKFISNPQYTPMLINKLVNIEFDVCGRADDFEAPFKTITSGEPVNCSDKYVKTFSFSPFCKLALAANEFPRITDHSSAFYKRLLLLPCNRVFEQDEQNINLKKDLLAELPGILNWALKGLHTLEKRGGFIHYAFMKESIKELREKDNASEVFLEEFIEVLEGESITKKELYDKYVAWSKENNCGVLSVVNFGKAVWRKYSKYTVKKAQNSELKWVWKNLKFIEPYEKDRGWEN